MLQIALPGAEDMLLEHLVCDVNGTLALDGQITATVLERLRLLAVQLQMHLVTADTYGTLPQLVATLQHEGVAVQTRCIAGGEEKAAYVQALGPEQVVALGNGVNDVGMLQHARLSIAICGPEGLAKTALQAATLVVATPESALDLLLHPRRLTATLRP
jgi:soluble P-type ATPase